MEQFMLWMRNSDYEDIQKSFVESMRHCDLEHNDYCLGDHQESGITVFRFLQIVFIMSRDFNICFTLFKDLLIRRDKVCCEICLDGIFLAISQDNGIQWLYDRGMHKQENKWLIRVNSFASVICDKLDIIGWDSNSLFNLLFAIMQVNHGQINPIMLDKSGKRHELSCLHCYDPQLRSLLGQHYLTLFYFFWNNKRLKPVKHIDAQSALRGKYGKIIDIEEIPCLKLLRDECVRNETHPNDQQRLWFIGILGPHMNEPEMLTLASSFECDTGTKNDNANALTIRVKNYYKNPKMFSPPCVLLHEKGFCKFADMDTDNALMACHGSCNRTAKPKDLFSKKNQDTDSTNTTAHN